MHISLSTNLSKGELQQLSKLYIESFPEDERRPEEALFGSPPMGLTLWAIRYEETLIGMVTTWQWADVLYIEHFALDPRERGQGYGAEVLRQLKDSYPEKALLLECEPESLSDEARRRLAFYRRQGFEVLPVDYIQPAYSASQKPVPLLLLSTKEFTREASALLAVELHRRIYGVTE